MDSASSGGESFTPTPRRFYIHDDVSDKVREIYGADSTEFRLIQELFRVVRQDPERVVVLTLEEQIEQLLALGDHASFPIALCIGRAGERVAEQLHERTGWFPVRRRVDITREEDGLGGYNLVSTTGMPLESQLEGLEAFPTLAVVDDTVFSGLTMRTVLRALPPGILKRTHVFCLKCVAETLPRIDALCPISVGLAAPGRILEEVSLINASGLVMPVGIRRSGKSPLAFFERPSWIRAWFPGYADEVIAICRRLSSILAFQEQPPENVR